MAGPVRFGDAGKLPVLRYGVMEKRKAARWVYVGTDPEWGTYETERQAAADSDWTVMVFVKRKHR